MMSSAQSAFAVLTPPGRGGIAVIRCIGPGAEAAIARCFRPARAQRQPLPGCLAYGHIVDAEGRALDEIILHREGPAAFEVNCHGGPAAVKAVCTLLAALGLAEADADHLLELEGLPRIARQARRALRAATTPLAARILLNQLNGALAAAIREIVAGLAPSLAPRTGGGRAADAPSAAPPPVCSRGAKYDAPAAAISEIVSALTPRGAQPLAPGEYTGGGRAADAPCAAPPPVCSRGAKHGNNALAGPPRGAQPLAPGEYTGGGRAADAPCAAPPPVCSRGANYGDNALAGLDALLARWRTCGRLLADPPRIAIAGRPNSGKSTLLNRLVGAERAITSPQPGTTRDTVEAEAALEGVPAVLVDTAGLREASGEIERAGVERARREAARAAVVVYLIDATAGLEPEDEASIDALGDRALAVWNKIDAPSAATRTGARDAPAISALTGDGIPALVAELLARLGWRAVAWATEAVPFTAEQAAALEAAREALADGRAKEARATLAALLR